MFSGSRMNARSCFAVADIGSASIGCAIVQAGAGAARILASERFELPASSRSSEAARSVITSALGEVAERVLQTHVKRGGSRVDAVFAIIRAPWTRTRTIRAIAHLEEEMQLRKGVVDDLVKRALEQQPFFKAEDILDASVIRVELNGYPTAHPIGKNAHSIVASVLVSDCDGAIRAAALESLARVFSTKPIMRSGVRAVFMVLRHIAALPSNCLAVEITTGGSVLVTIRKGIAREHSLVEAGAGDILKQLTGGVPPEEARTLLRLALADECETDACKDIKARITKAEPALVKAFGEALAKLSATRRLPNDLILIAPDSVAQYMQHFFERIDLAQFTVTTQPFSARVLSQKDLAALVTPAEGVYSDIGIGVGAALVNIEANDAAGRGTA